MTRALLPGASLHETAGFSVACGFCVLGLVTFVVLAVTNSPLGATEAWIGVALSIGLGGAALLSGASDRVRRDPAEPERTAS